MRKEWTINQNFEEQFEMALDQLDHPQSDNDENDNLSELPDTITHLPDDTPDDSPYRSCKL